MKNLERGKEKVPVADNTSVEEENDESVKIKENSPLVDKFNEIPTNAIPNVTRELKGYFIRLFAILVLDKNFHFQQTSNRIHCLHQL